MTTRKDYINKAKARLDRWDAQIDEMEARVAEAGVDANAAYKAQLEEMKSKREEARDVLAGLQDASGDAWEDMRASAEASWTELKRGFDKARARFA